LADYWMKLYIEILDDPKMATLPDRLWRRIVELFLMAKRENKDGHLPDTRQIAWALRMSADELDHDLKSITSTGIIIQEAGGWFIPNFAKRQGPSTDAERKSQERSRKRSQQYYGNVTELSRIVTQSTDNREQNTDTETNATAAVFTAYQQNIGQVTKITMDQIDADIKEYSPEWVTLAIEKSVKAEKRSLAYVEGILKAWKRDGFGVDARTNNNGRRAALTQASINGDGTIG
jgi:DnaD/phage-associated family protein